MALTTGFSIGQYEILAPFGGSHDNVYRAMDRRANRPVVIKVLPADLARDERRRARLLEDAQTVASFSHPSVVSLLDVGEDEQQEGLYLVFEDIPGSTLATVLAERHLSPQRAVGLAIQLADTLADAHAYGLVHRDFQPANVIVTQKGTAKILLLGISSGTPLGPATPYRAPEQILGGVGDEQSDVFSLGVMLFQMLSGRPPFVGRTPSELAQQIVHATVDPPSIHDPAIPAELNGIVVWTLAKDPEVRCGSAAALAAELRGIAAIIDLRRELQPRRAPASTTRPLYRKLANLLGY